MFAMTGRRQAAAIVLSATVAVCGIGLGAAHTLHGPHPALHRVRIAHQGLAGTEFEGVAFVTPDRGWVGSSATLYATTDGGATWTPLQFAPRINRMRVLRSDLVYAWGDRVYRWTP